MTTPRKNGRPTEAGTPVAASTGASRHSTTCPKDNTLALLREADENATDGELDVWVSYRIRWNAFLAQGGE